MNIVYRWIPYRKRISVLSNLITSLWQHVMENCFLIAAGCPCRPTILNCVCVYIYIYIQLAIVLCWGRICDTGLPRDSARQRCYDFLFQVHNRMHVAGSGSANTSPDALFSSDAPTACRCKGREVNKVKCRRLCVALNGFLHVNDIPNELTAAADACVVLCAAAAAACAWGSCCNSWAMHGCSSATGRLLTTACVRQRPFSIPNPIIAKAQVCLFSSLHGAWVD